MAESVAQDEDHTVDPVAVASQLSFLAFWPRRVWWLFLILFVPTRLCLVCAREPSPPTTGARWWVEARQIHTLHHKTTFGKEKGMVRESGHPN
jgi:hypothetical protein